MIMIEGSSRMLGAGLVAAQPFLCAAVFLQPGEDALAGGAAVLTKKREGRDREDIIGAHKAFVNTANVVS